VHPDAFLREWEYAIRSGQRPPRVKDRVFPPSADAWNRLVMTACTERHSPAAKDGVAGEGQKGMTKVARS
jgi:hypothetical protein